MWCASASSGNISRAESSFFADSYLSVIESIKHGAASWGVRPEIKWLDSGQFEGGTARISRNSNRYDGIIVPGGFGSRGVEGKLAAIRYCREHKIPYFGLCYGMQLATVEFARNVLGLKGANTTEIDPKTKYPIIDILPEQKKLDGGEKVWRDDAARRVSGGIEEGDDRARGVRYGKDLRAAPASL